MKKHNRTKSVLAFSVLSLCLSDNVIAEWQLDTEGKLKYDSNLDNAVLSKDVVGDGVFAFSAAGGFSQQLTDNNNLSIRGEFNGEVYDTFQGMNNTLFGLNVTLRRKWLLGLYAPWSSLSVSTARLNYDNTVRDGWRYQLQLSTGKRLSERWDVWADMVLEKRTADHNVVVDTGVSGAVFNQTNKIFKLNSVYAFNSRSYLTFGYQLRHGDVASTVLMDRHEINFDAVMSAVTLDSTFGHEAEAYRLTGTTHTLGARISMMFATHFVVGLEYQYQFTNAKGNNTYVRSLPALTLSYSF